MLIGGKIDSFWSMHQLEYLHVLFDGEAYVWLRFINIIFDSQQFLTATCTMQFATKLGKVHKTVTFTSFKMIR